MVAEPARDIIQMLNDNPLIIIFGVGLVISIVGIVFGSMCSIVRSITREKTRREIAAYIAEGSMTPEQGERVLRADPDSYKNA